MIVMLLSVLMLGLISVTTLTSQQIMTSNALSETAYETESVANRINYLTRIKLRNNNFKGQRSNIFDNILTGATREIIINNQVYCYKIIDAAGGLNFSSTNPSKAISILQKYYQKKQKKSQQLVNLSAIIKDYNDMDNFLSTNGAEFTSYSNKQLNLPRNSRIQFRSEILFIPMARKFLFPDNDGRLTMVKLIVPKGLRNVGSKRNLLNIKSKELQYLGDFNKNQSQGIFNTIRTNSTNDLSNLTTNFTPDIAQRLKNNFSSKPSGIYTIKVWKKSGKNNSKNGISRIYFVTEDLKQTATKNAHKTKKRQLYEALSY